MEKNPYLRLVAAVLFAAVCAYAGAALYPRLAFFGAVPAMSVREGAPVRLEGIALRHELALSLPRDAALFDRDGERLSAGTAMAAMAGESPGENRGSCLFLAFSDGLEFLSPADALPLRVDRVRALMSRQPEDAAGTARLVQGFDWYYAAVTDYRGALPEGKCSLRFDGFQESVSGRLVEAGPYENGERALLFRLTTGDTDYLKLRNTGAELILPG